MATADVSWLQSLPLIEGSTGLAAETDAALELSGAAGQEAQVAWLQITPQAATDVGMAASTEAAFSLVPSEEATASVTWLQIEPIPSGAGIAAEADSAFALAPSTQIGVVAQTSWLQITVGGPGSVDRRTAGAWSPAMRARYSLLDGGIILATEADTALALLGTLPLDVGLAVEADTALALTGTDSFAGLVGLAAGTDTAFGLSMTILLDVGLAVEQDRAFTTELFWYGVVGLAVEVDSAIPSSDTFWWATTQDNAFSLRPSAAGDFWVPCPPAPGEWASR
ncbi:MAG: hypothetical protein RL375_4486 [Pseudomonadota bacterium]